MRVEGTPDPRRLGASARMGRKIRMDKEFRESLPVSKTGERRIVVADAENSLREVFERVMERGMPLTICVPAGSSFLSIIVTEPSGENEAVPQDCGPDTSLGMLISFLLTQGGNPVRIKLTEPLRLQFA